MFRILIGSTNNRPLRDSLRILSATGRGQSKAENFPDMQTYFDHSIMEGKNSLSPDALASARLFSVAAMSIVANKEMQATSSLNINQALS